MPKYITIGNVTLDDVVLPDGTFMKGAFGGGSIYSAAGARIWSNIKGSIGIISKVGKTYPEENLQSLQSFGFDVQGISKADMPNIRVWMLYEGQGKRQIIFHLDSGRSPEMDPQYYDFISAYDDIEFAHIAPMAVSSQIGFAKLLNKKGIPFSFDLAMAGPDVNPRDLLDSGGLAECKIFLPSEQEVHAIWDDEITPGLIKKISGMGPEIIAIKMGEQGSLVYDKQIDQSFHIPALPIDVTDTTGAGDSYCGGFMVGYHQTRDTVKAALRGTVSASYAVQTHSAWQMLSADLGDAQKRLDWLQDHVEPLSI